jgi:hypothetical protein
VYVYIYIEYVCAALYKFNPWRFQRVKWFVGWMQIHSAARLAGPNCASKHPHSRVTARLPARGNVFAVMRAK